MVDRNFGVELEFTTNGKGQRWAREILTSEGISWDQWSFDGSELELKSPILSGREGFKELKKVMDTLRHHGCETTTRHDGLHIHHDAPDYCGFKNKENLVRLVKSWIDNESEIINQFVMPIRRGRTSCPPWNYNLLIDLENDRYTVDRHDQYRDQDDGWDHLLNNYGRRSLNIDALKEHGTIEIRLHEGTLDFEKAEAWIKFGQKFLNSCIVRKRPIPKLADRNDLLKRIKINKKAHAVLSEKANAMF
jgi:hypothetical protein